MMCNEMRSEKPDQPADASPHGPQASIRIIRDFLTVLLRDQGSVMEHTRRELYEIMREECLSLESHLRGADVAAPMLPSTWSGETVDVLLVDDNATHVLLMHEANRSCDSPFHMAVAGDGEQALEMLRSGAVRPRLILLDLYMPRLDGRGVLRELKSDERLRHIPVVVFSSSEDAQDVRDAYELQASSYIVKPAGLPALAAVIRVLAYFWLRTARRA